MTILIKEVKEMTILVFTLVVGLSGYTIGRLQEQNEHLEEELKKERDKNGNEKNFKYFEFWKR